MQGVYIAMHLIHVFKCTKTICKTCRKLNVIPKSTTMITNAMNIGTTQNGCGKLLMRQYFPTMGKEFAAKIPAPHTKFRDYLKMLNCNTQTLFLRPTTNTEILKIIQNLPNKSSSGFDNISNTLLKKLGH